MTHIRLPLSVALLLTVLTPLALSAQVTSLAVVPSGLGQTINVIDAATRTVVQAVPAPGAYASVVSADGRRAYVVDHGGALRVFDLLSGTVEATITGFSSPYAVALSPDGQTAYVANEGNNTVGIVDLSTNTVTGSYAVGPFPIGVAVRPDGQMLYTIDPNGDDVWPVDLTSGLTLAPIHVGDSPFSIRITPDSTKAYVASTGTNSVTVIDLMTATVIANIPVGVVPSCLAVSPDGREVYVTNAMSDNVSVIDVLTDSVVATIPSGGSQPVSVAFTPDGRVAYVANFNSNTVVTINTVSRAVEGTPIPVATGPNSYSPFTGPNVIVPAGGVPLDAANDAALQTLGFRSHVNFGGGILRLTGDLTTSRTVDLRPSNGQIDTNGFTATLAGTITGDGVLSKVGNGTLVLSGNATHMWTHVYAGRVLVTGTHMPTLEVETELAGTGTVGPVTMWSPQPTIVSPGDNGPGELTAANVLFRPSTTLAIDITGPAAGTQYDRLTSTGVSALAQATLSVTVLPAYVPAPGTTFTIATHTSGTFAGLAEGATFVVDGKRFSISYVGGSGNDVVLTAVADAPPTLTTFGDTTIPRNTVAGPIAFAIGDDWTAVSALAVTATSSDHALVPDENIVIGGSGAARTLTITPIADAVGVTTITVSVTDGQAQVTSRTFQLTVENPELTYYLSEGATGAFFDTDLLLANPTATAAPITIAFLRDDGTTVNETRTLAPTSRTTIHVDDLGGLEATTFSTVVTSTEGVPIAVERTMWWDQTGYGAHTEKASEGTSTQWYFAEGAQGFFKTYFLLENPHATANVAHVTYYRQGAAPVTHDYPLLASSRTTIDAGDEPGLRWQSFGALVTFDLPGMAERAMYFGSHPLLGGGSASAGITTPSTLWYLAEGATGSFFSTFVLITNPNDEAAPVTLTYLRDAGDPIVVTHTVPAHERLTIDAAGEAPALAAATFSVTVAAGRPVVVERSVYWPRPAWIESHNSAGVTAPGTAWALAEGRVGGANNAQTFILLANPNNAVSADVTLTFLRADGTTLVKQVTVGASRRVTVAIAGPDSDVPQLANEMFGTRIESTQPIIVERSMYTDANGVTWAAGTNATATRVSLH